MRREHPYLRRPSVLVAGLLASAFVALGACGKARPAARWIPLARGFEPRPLAEQLAEWEQAAPRPSATRIEVQPPGVLLERPIATEEWARAGEGLLSFTLPDGALKRSGARLGLVGRACELALAAPGSPPAPGEIQIDGRRLLMRLPAGARRAIPVVLVRALEHGGEREIELPAADWRAGESAGVYGLEFAGVASAHVSAGVRAYARFTRVDAAPGAAFEYALDGERVLLALPGDAPLVSTLVSTLDVGEDVDGSWRLRVGQQSANGIPVWSGTRAELGCDLPPESQLAFRFVHAAPPGATPVVARVFLDGELLLERSFAHEEWSEPTFVVHELPRVGRPGARLAFEVAGPPGLGAFLAPIVGPREIGSAAARPWPSAPDLVLFLADTFRADGLALYGGNPELAPHLNRFAQHALSFRNARSSAAWTLPSTASILSGLQPGQHGATDQDRMLPRALETLPERLQRAGYRTAAITDGNFLTPEFGLDQGFEWFRHYHHGEWDLDRSLAAARAFLEQDDGRPVFLLLHTYRVHQPYRVGPDEDAEPYYEYRAAAAAEGDPYQSTEPARQARLERYSRELRALYDEGVRDLDRGFGELVSFLEERRFFEHGALAFTSDHGESMGENGDFLHGGHLWETKLAVPLFLRGAGLAPRVVSYAAGPIDLAPTFAELAGIAADPSWSGSSLVTLARERPAFAFQLTARHQQAAISEGRRKILFTPERSRLASGDCEQAFDLAQDPREEHNLAQAAEWPAELLRKVAPDLARFLEARAAAESALLSPELRSQLDALGYGEAGN